MKLIKFATIFVLSINYAQAQAWVNPEQKQVGYTPNLLVRSVYEIYDKIHSRLKIIVRYDDSKNKEIAEQLRLNFAGFRVNYSPVRRQRPFKFKLTYGDHREIEVGVFQGMDPVIQSENFVINLTADEQIEASRLIKFGNPLVEVISLSGLVEEYIEKQNEISRVACGSILTNRDGVTANILKNSDSIASELETRIHSSVSQNVLLLDLLSTCFKIENRAKVAKLEHLFSSNFLNLILQQDQVYILSKHRKGFTSSSKELPFTLVQEQYNFKDMVRAK